MVDLQLWLVILNNTSVDRTPLRAAHREYMADLVARGLIFASGPIATMPTSKTYGGATVLRVTEEAEAREIMEDEPFVRGGARTYDLIAWNIRHGNFSTGNPNSAQAVTEQ